MKSLQNMWLLMLAFSGLVFPQRETPKAALFSDQEAAVIRAFVAAIEADDLKKIESLLAPQEKKLLQGAKGKFPFAVLRRLKTFKTRRLLHGHGKKTAEDIKHFIL